MIQAGHLQHAHSTCSCVPLASGTTLRTLHVKVFHRGNTHAGSCIDQMTQEADCSIHASENADSPIVERGKAGIGELLA